MKNKRIDLRRGADDVTPPAEEAGCVDGGGLQKAITGAGGSAQTPLIFRNLAVERARAASVLARRKRLAKEAKDKLDAIEERFIAALKRDELESVRVRGFNYTAGKHQFAEIFDRDEYFEYACEPGNRDLLHKRISMEAAHERWSQGIEIPGVRQGSRPFLSVQKAASKRVP